jgi:hypothetical protein
LTNKFALRFVIEQIMSIFEQSAYFLVTRQRSRTWRTKMRKTILTILGAALIASSVVPLASASEQQQARKPVRALVQANQSFRQSNDAMWSRPQATRDWISYENRAGAGAVAH